MVQPPSERFTLAELRALQKLEAEREADRAFITQADEDFLFLFGELCTRLGVDFPEDD